MRTYQEFVEDMVSSGRSLKEIRAVAMSTRWRGVLSDVTEHAKNLLKYFVKVDSGS